MIPCLHGIGPSTAGAGGYLVNFGEKWHDLVTTWQLERPTFTRRQSPSLLSLPSFLSPPLRSSLSLFLCTMCNKCTSPAGYSVHICVDRSESCTTFPCLRTLVRSWCTRPRLPVTVPSCYGWYIIKVACRWPMLPSQAVLEVILTIPLNEQIRFY